MKNYILFLILLPILFLACDDDQPEASNCDEQVTIDRQKYEDASSDTIPAQEISISDNCLNIKFSLSGCDGETWEVELIDSEAILESDPIQRQLKLSVINNEACLAFITKEVSFDISDLQNMDDDQVRLNITNLNETILYEY